VTSLDEDEIELLREAIEIVREKIASDADRHYSTFIFKPRFDGDTPVRKYREEYAQREASIVERLEKIVDDES
jgi:hypothetical protein